MIEKKHSDVITNIIIENDYKNVAEIGVWEGWLTKDVLNSPAHKIIKQYWAIDQWDILSDPDWQSWRKITKEEWDRKYLVTCQLMRYFPYLKVVRMPSIRAAKMFWKNYFDLVYIDGDHRYDAVKADIEAWLPLVRKGGIIAGHDYLFRDGKGRRSVCGVKPAVDDYFREAVVEKTDTVWVVQR